MLGYCAHGGGGSGRVGALMRVFWAVEISDIASADIFGPAKVKR